MQPYRVIVALHAGSETEQTALCIEAKTHDIHQRSLPDSLAANNQAVGKSQVKRSNLFTARICLVEAGLSNQAIVIVT